MVAGQVMKEMGQSCSDDELFVMISSIDEDASGFITFSEFLKVTFSSAPGSFKRQTCS